MNQYVKNSKKTSYLKTCVCFVIHLERRFGLTDKDYKLSIVLHVAIVVVTLLHLMTSPKRVSTNRNFALI